MRTFKILKNCVDKHTGRQLPAGTILEVDDARAKELEAVPAYASEIRKEPDPVTDPEETKTLKKAPAKKKTAGRKKKEA